MKMNKVTSVEDYKIVSSFQTLKKTLLEDRYADRLEKPLAYWALPNDRRLPLAFLGRTIRDLLATPFEELSATPGIGQKKISSLVKLLSRATKDHPPAVPFGLNEINEAKKPAQPPRVPAMTDFDPSIVSEALWSEWQQTVVDNGLGRELLGRLAPTLQALPTVIWHTPLSHYVDRTVAEIRQMKTHGEKRVRVVLEVFYQVHGLLSGAGTSGHLALRVVPGFTVPIESWLSKAIADPALPTAEEVCDNLTVPLLHQIQIDSGDAIYDLCATRLGVDGAPQSVRVQAKRMNVTRARVYQLLEEASRVMAVRWPEGKNLLAQLDARYHAEGTPQEDPRMLRATFELFYPGKYQMSDEDTADEPHEVAEA
jgi:hypothetical protein